MSSVVIADGGEELDQQLVVACLQLRQDVRRHFDDCKVLDEVNQTCYERAKKGVA